MKLHYDFSELVEFGNKLSTVETFETYLMTIARNIARVLHSHLLNNTPVDTGNLRKMWSAGENLLFTVKKVNGGYEVTLINTAKNNGFMYGRAVNYGHRTPSGGWIMGRFFVEASITQTETQINNIVMKELQDWYRWCISGK